MVTLCLLSSAMAQVYQNRVGRIEEEVDVVEPQVKAEQIGFTNFRNFFSGL